LLLPAAAALLVLIAGQSGGSVDRRAGGGGNAPVEEAPATEEPLPPAPSDSITGPPGVPFMPSVGAPAPTRRGVFLDVALLSQVQARTLTVTDAATTWGTYLEVTPGLALEVGSSNFSLSVGYAPRFTVPFNVGDFQLAVLNRATLRAVWSADKLWTVTALGIFVVGDYSQLNPASTPGGPGPPPPVLNPVRSFQTYPYVGIDTLLRVEGVISHRSSLRFAGGYFDVGGTGAVGEAAQPRTWGPQAEAAFAWDASHAATLTTTAAAQDWMMVGDFSIILASLSESWKQSWTDEFDTTVSAGLGVSNRDIESRTAAGHIAPLATLRLEYHSDSHDTLRFGLDAALSPYVDTYLRIPYQRFTAGLTIAWRPSDAWQLGASLAAALAPYSVRAPESYGTAGLSASFAPVQFLVFTIGGFTQAQFQGPETSTGAFRQWSVYVSLALLDKLAL
jgi:hypothetical protein